MGTPPPDFEVVEEVVVVEVLLVELVVVELVVVDVELEVVVVGGERE